MKLSFSIIFTMIINLICTSVFLIILNDSGKVQKFLLQITLKNHLYHKLFQIIVFCIFYYIII